MSQLILSHQGPILDETKMRAAESAIGIVLPPIYRSFLFEHNGGIPNRRLFTIPGHSEGSDLLDCFYSIGISEKSMDLVHNIQSLSSYQRAGWLAIGHTACSSLVCLDIGTSDREGILYIDIADPLDDRELKRTYPIARNVAQFCESLKEYSAQ